MLTLTREIHGIAAETLHEYLIRLGGENQPGGIIVGKEWRASIRQLPDYQLGKAFFCCFLVEITGKKEVVEKTMQQFDLRIMRPGG